MMKQIPDSITCLVYCTWLQHACNECLLRWLLRMRWPHLHSERQPSIRACTDPSTHTPKRKHANTYTWWRLQVESWKDSRFMLRNHVPVTTLSKEGQESEDLLHNYVDHLRHNCSQLPSILSSDTPSSVTSSHFSSGFFQGAHFRLWDDRLTVRGILSFALDHCKSHCLL